MIRAVVTGRVTRDPRLVSLPKDDSWVFSVLAMSGTPHWVDVWVRTNDFEAMRPLVIKGALVYATGAMWVKKGANGDPVICMRSNDVVVMKRSARKAPEKEG